MIDELKTNPPANSVVLFFDEKGKTPIKHYEGKMWFDDKNGEGKNAIYKVPDKQHVKGLVDYFAAKDYHAGKIYYGFYDWKNAFIVNDFFQGLLNAIPGKNIFVVMDCWSAHAAAAVKIFADLNPRLKLVFLPTKASWMNVIEQYFSHVERFVLRNSNFQNVPEMMDALVKFATFGTQI